MNLIKKRGLGRIAAIFSFALLFTSNLYGEETKALMPYDFYQGVELDTLDKTSPFYWLELPVNAYINSAHPQTLQDVRVFNGTGDEVPSALFYDAEKTISTSTLSFTPQRLVVQSDKVNSRDEDRNERQYLLVEATPGKVSRIALSNIQGKQNTQYQAYLLTQDKNKDNPMLAQNLTLDWSNSETEWQAKVFVYASTDKENWINISANQPIMSLKLDSGIISSNSIELLRGNASALSAPYFMVIAVSAPDMAIPDLQKVHATLDVLNSTRRQEVFHFEMTNDGVSREHVIYQLPSTQPLSELQVQLQQSNRVIPLKIEYSSDKGDIWKPLTDIVAYNQSSDGESVSNPNIALNGEMIRSLRITALKGSWEDLPPRIDGKRDAINIIFNMQGAAPYLLVWGNYQTQIEKMTYRDLIGQPYSVDEVMNRYPELYATGKTIELGGEEKLTKVEQLEGGSNWMTIALWILLFIGIVVLLYFCWYLLKEVNSSNKNQSDDL